MSESLHVTHAVLSLDTGGLERIVVDLVRDGQRLGQRVSVLCLERPGKLAAQVEDLGAHVVCINKKPGIRLSVSTQINRALRGLRPDVLHTHQIGALFYAGQPAKDQDIPVIVHTEHINNIRKGGSGYYRRQKMSWLWWWAARQAQRFFCVSEDIAEEMAARRIVPREKLVVILNGINTEPFRKPVDRNAIRASLGIALDAPVIGTVGRLNEVKCQDLLLHAFARIKGETPNAQLVLVGDGPMLGDLTNLAKQLGLADSVHFLGYQAHPEQFLGIMDIFALTSRMEGLPLAILEAWAAGLPVIASSVGGVPDLIEKGRTGLLFESGDEGALASLLSNLLSKPEFAKTLGDAGRDVVHASYDSRRMAADYQEHYLDLLARARSRMACAS